MSNEEITYYIMAASNLENIMGRLNCCRAVFGAIQSNAVSEGICLDALSGAYDLLGSICRDFRADIDAAEDYRSEREVQ